MASSAALELVIGVTDKATGPLKGITGALGDIAKFGATAALGAATAGVVGLGAALVAGIGDAREASLLLAQTENVIKSTGGAAGVTAEQVTDLATALSASSGKSLFGDSQIQESENLLLTFTNIKGSALEAATAMSVDLAQAMGGAPKDSAIQLGKALNDPIAGISALSRVGVSFTEQQKEQIKTMQEAGDMAGAQGIILAELNKEFGGSAAAAAAADGGMAQFKDRMGELAESIGAQVLPLLNQLMAWLNSPEIQSAITNIGTNLVGAVVAAAAGFSSFMTTIQPIIGFVQDNLTAVLAALATMLIVVVVPAFIAWATAAGAAAIATITALAPVLIPIAAIGAAVGLLVTAWENDWGGMRTVLSAWWTGTVEPILTVVKQWLDTTLTTALTTLQTTFGYTWPAIQAIIGFVYDWLRTVVWPWFGSAFSVLANVALPALQKAFDTVWPAIKTAVSATYTFLKDTVWPWLETAMSNIGTWITTAQVVWSAAWSLISGAVDTAKNTISGAIDTIKGLIDGAIAKINGLITAINSIPGINIPTIPTAPTGGGSGSNGIQSIGPRTSLGNTNHVAITINATNRHEAEIGVKSALRAAGLL